MNLSQATAATPPTLKCKITCMIQTWLKSSSLLMYLLVCYQNLIDTTSSRHVGIRESHMQAGYSQEDGRWSCPPADKFMPSIHIRKVKIVVVVLSRISVWLQRLPGRSPHSISTAKYLRTIRRLFCWGKVQGC